MRFLNLDPEISSISFNSLNTFQAINTSAPKSEGEMKGLLDLFDNSRTGWFNQISPLKAELPNVRLSEQKSPGRSGRNRVLMDIDQALIDNVPGIERSLHGAYTAMKNRPWMWNEKGFENPEDAFNAYITGGFSLKAEDFNTVADSELETDRRGRRKATPSEQDEPLSVQNNNPGNLRSFGDVPTVETKSGKFAKFESIEAGTRALARDLSTKIGRGDNSIEDILKQFSPDEDPKNIERGLKVEDYIKFAEKSTGLKRDKVINSDADVAKLMRAIIDFESGKKSALTDEQILQGIEDAKSS